MKKITTHLIALVLLFCTIAAFSQKKSDGKKELARFIMKECGHTVLDSAQVVTAVYSLCTFYKVNKVKLVRNGTSSSHCLPFGTMFLNIVDSDDICRVFINELPHAQQFSEAPLSTSILFLKGFVATLCNSFFLTKKEKQKVARLHSAGCEKWVARIWVAYERQEFIRDSAENDAHQKRQPVIASQVSYLLASN